MSYTFDFLFVHLFQAIGGMFFLESIFRSSDVYGADDFRDFRSVAGTTTLCAPADVLTALLPGSARFESVQGVFGASWMFFSGEKV